MTPALQSALQKWADAITAIDRGDGRQIGQLLGSHTIGRQVLVLTFIGGEATRVMLEGRRRMVQCGTGPIYAWLGDRNSLPAHYRIDWTDRYGARHQRVDPYSLGCGQIAGEGGQFSDESRSAAEHWGAECTVREGIDGIHFAVWAPRALGVQVTLPGGALALYPHLPSGVWSLFVPQLPAGTPYGYELTLSDGSRQWRTDPCGRAFEARPSWRARVPGMSHFRFDDAAWLRSRAREGASAPLSIYEVHLGSFLRRPAEAASYAALAERIVRHVAPLGFTHVECLPITEHPFEGSWGYQTTGYHAPTHRHGSPDDFRGFVDRLHRAGLGVILDWVPGHFAIDQEALATFDGAPLYEYDDPVHSRHQGWGTLVFDLTRPQVRAFLLASARRFLREYHVDGLRIDAVAAMLYRDYDRAAGQWTPNADGGREDLAAIEFLRELTSVLHEEFPGVLLIAEDSSLFPGVTRPVGEGGLGFDYKWNLGWMHDSLRYFREDPLFRRHHHALLPQIPSYSRRERGVLALSHDEVVHGKRSIIGRMPGDDWQQMANLRLLLAWQWTHPGAKLLFMGTELAAAAEWDHQKAMPWERLQLAPVKGLLHLIGDLNTLYRDCPALHGPIADIAGVRFISQSDDLRSIYVYERRQDDHLVIVILNATPVPREQYVVGLPRPGQWHEWLNTDSAHYGGSDVGNWGAVIAEREPAMGEPCSATVRLPPLGALILSTTPPRHSYPNAATQGASTGITESNSAA